MGKAVYLPLIPKFILLAFFVFAAVQVFSDDSSTTNIKEQLILAMGDDLGNAFHVGIFVKTLDHLSPMVTLYDIPFYDGDIFLVNKFPLIGWTHILLITFLMLVLGWTARLKRISPWMILLIGMFIIIGSYFIGSAIDYGLYHYSAGKLGISGEDANIFLEEFSNSLEDVVFPMLIYCGVALVVLLKYLFRALVNRKK